MGFRNPITSAAAVDTRPATGAAGVRMYEAANPDTGAPRGVVEWSDGLPGDVPAQAVQTASPSPRAATDPFGRLAITGGAYAVPAGGTMTAPELDLGVEQDAAGHPIPVAAIRGAPLRVSAVTDLFGADLYNAGTSTAILGNNPPAGTRLLTKLWSGVLTGNAAGDATIVFPGGGFTNGLVGVSVTAWNWQATGPGPYTWIPYLPTSLTSINVRCFQFGAATPPANPKLGATVVLIGW